MVVKKFYALLNLSNFPCQSLVLYDINQEHGHDYLKGTLNSASPCS